MAMQVAPGKYYAKITGHKLAEASTGNVQVQFTIEVLGGYDPDNPDQLTPEGAGLTRTVFRAITDATVQRVYAELDKLGYTGDGFSLLDASLAGDQFINLSGIEVWVRCTENTWQGKSNERWEFDLMGGGGIETATPEAKKARQIDTQFSRAKAGVAKPAAAGKPAGPKTGTPAKRPVAAATTGGGEESEIPY